MKDSLLGPSFDVVQGVTEEHCYKASGWDTPSLRKNFMAL